MRKSVVLAGAVLLLASAICAAQTPPQPPPQVPPSPQVPLSPPAPPGDPIGQQLFPPELVMQYQRAIGLTAAQRSGITDAIAGMQSKVLTVQWDMQTESQKLVELLGGTRVDEAAVLAQVDRVLALEREVKRRQIALLIKIKNTLSAEQQNKLRSLRSESPR